VISEAAIVEGLTEAQCEAVSHVDGPVLVLAGPGSGKTTVITRRVAYLIAQGIPPWQILALTFTNKAAGEMRLRAEAMLPEDLPGRRGLTVATFHSFCARLLRRWADRVNIAPGYSIYDSADQRDAIKQALKNVGLDPKNFTPGSVHEAISRAKNQLMDADAFAAHADDFYSKSIAKVYRSYERILRENQALDFDDLLMRTARLLKDDEPARAELEQRFQYVMIDEYQDTNHAQFEIAHALAKNHQNMFVVGDPDQSIYGWRGADIRNILEFETHFPKARVIPLGQNFRSTGFIVSAADALIRHNKFRRDKRLHTELGEGEKPTVITCADEHDEARAVVERLRRHNDAGLAWKDMAVLYRVNALSRVMEEALRTEQVPYTIARGTAFYDRKEIKDALAYLRVLANPSDEVSLRRIINTPTRGIGAAALNALESAAAARGERLIEVMQRADSVEALSARARKSVQALVAMLQSWRAEAVGEGRAGLLGFSLSEAKPTSLPPPFEGGGKGVGGAPGRESGALFQNMRPTHPHSPSLRGRGSEGADAAPGSSGAPRKSLGFTEADDAFTTSRGLGQLVERVIRESGLESMYARSKGEEDLERLENLEELVSAAAQFEPPSEVFEASDEALSPIRLLQAFLEGVALVSDADQVDPASGAVTLMTLHTAKGLEFDTVAMIGMEEGLLPHSRAAMDERELEEERRLCFVGMTRAKRHLIMSRALVRTHRGLRERTIPSQFLNELPEQAVGEAQTEYAGSPFLDDMDDRAPRSWSQHERTRGFAGDETPGGAFPIGCMVRHPRFGVGRVEAIGRQGQATRARIAFTGLGVKTLIVEYANLQRV
jgi:DNA helicase-2/ATP-dependent DNA helicase PcrA